MELYYIALLLMIPAILFALWASGRVNSVFRALQGQATASYMTAEQAARRILDAEGLRNVEIRRVRGTLTDHYNPKDNTVYLSDAVYGNRSVAAVGVAAHEVGHAIQHNKGYLPLKLRSALVPVVNFCSKMAFPLILIGFFMGAASAFGSIAYWIAVAGIIVYGASVIFALVTLPVEFNASNRAKKILGGMSDVTEDDVRAAGKMLNAAAMTYVASFLLSAIYLLRYMGLFASRRR